MFSTHGGSSCPLNEDKRRQSPVVLASNLTASIILGVIMSSLEDSVIEQEVEDYWLSQGEAVYREMCEDDWPEQKGEEE